LCCATTERVTPFRLLAFAVNAALLTYLLWTKHLFGIRGGVLAYRAKRVEMSVLEIDAASTSTPLGADSPHTR